MTTTWAVIIAVSLATNIFRILDRIERGGRRK